MIVTILVLLVLAFVWMTFSLVRGLRRWAPDTRTPACSTGTFFLIPLRHRVTVVLPWLGLVLAAFFLALTQMHETTPTGDLGVLVLLGSQVAIWGPLFVASYLHNGRVSARLPTGT
jgi:hypothetical protein